jgi:hypothetical protein
MAAPIVAGTPTTVDSGGSNVTSITLDLPAGLANGDLLVAAVFFQNSTGDLITAPSGWTRIGADTAAELRPSGFYVRPVPTASGTPTTFSFSTSASAGRALGVCFRVSGADLSSYLDVVSDKSSGTGTTSCVLPSMTTAGADRLVLGYCYTNTGAGPGLPTVTSANLTQVASASAAPGSNSVLWVGKSTPAAGATGTRTMSFSPSVANSGGYMFAIAPLPAITASPAGVATEEAFGSPSITADAPAAGVEFGSAGSRLLVGVAATAWDIPFPSGIAAGDLLLAHIITNGGTVSSTPPAGWVEVYRETANSNPKGGLWYKIADGTEAGAETFTVSSTTGNAMMFRYTGVDAATPFDGGATTVDNTVAAADAVVPSITTTMADSLLVYCCGLNSGSTTVTGPAGSTQRVDHNEVGGTGTKGGALFDEPFAGPGATGARTMTFASRTNWGIMVALMPNQGGTPAGTGTLVQRVVGIPEDPSTNGIVQVKVASTDSARLICSTDSAQTTDVVYGDAITPDADGNARLTVSGLTPGTRYYYRVEMTDASSNVSIDDEAIIGRLKTAPAGAASFAFDFGSCANSTDPIVFPLITARNDDMFFHLGDMFYNDGSGTSVANLRSKLSGKITQPNHAALYAQMNMAHVPGDHDVATNDTTNATDPTAWANWRQVSNELFPDPDLYYTFVWGRVRFIKLDLLNFKDDPDATDNSSKSAMGATQKQWLKDTIDAATEPVIVIIQADPWIGSAITGDAGWYGYTTERTELANYFAASGKNIAMIGGDMHAAAADDGTNSPGGIAYFAGSPFGQTASQKGGPYTEGPVPSSGTAYTTHYGRLVVTDSGGSIELAFDAYDETDTSIVSLTKTYSLGTTFHSSFDDGTNDGWTPSIGGAGTTAITSGAAHDGAFGASADVPATGDKAGFVRDFAGAQQATISGWWKVTTEGASTGSNVPFARLFYGTQRLADVYRQNGQAGANVWLRVVKAIGGSNYYFIPTGYTLPMDTWVYMSFTWGLDGIPHLSIDGVEYLNASDAPADFYAAPQIDRAYLGTHEAGNQGAWSMDSVDLTIVGAPPSTTASPSGLATEEAFGTPAISNLLVTFPAGVATGSAFGTPAASTSLVASPAGVASAQAMGSPAASTALTASPAGVASAQAFGIPTSDTALTASPSGIATAQTFGSPAITGNLAVSPGGIATAQAFGTPSIATTQSASPAAIASAEAFGSPSVAMPLTVSPAGIASAETFGDPRAAASQQAGPDGIPTGEAMGQPSASATLAVTPAGIASPAAFGTPSVTVQDLSQTASPTGIASAAAFGTPNVIGNRKVSPPGIASLEAFGTPKQSNVLVTFPANMPSIGNVFGAPSVKTTVTAAPAGIPSAQAFGTPTLVKVALLVVPLGMPSFGEFGTPVASGSLAERTDLAIAVKIRASRYAGGVGSPDTTTKKPNRWEGSLG